MVFLRSLLDRVQRYPVLFFGAVGAWIKAKVNIETGGADDLALTATILWLQSAFSLSKKTAEEQVEGAKYIGAVENQATSLAHNVIKNTRPLRSQKDAELHAD